jgi:hypothetical protein
VYISATSAYDEKLLFEEQGSLNGWDQARQENPSDNYE